MSEDNPILCSVCSRLYKSTTASKVPKELAVPLVCQPTTNGESGPEERSYDIINFQREKEKTDCDMKKRVQYHFYDHVFKLSGSTGRRVSEGSRGS